MNSSINLFLLSSLLLFLLNPKNMLPLLLSSSSETKLFELNSLPDGYLNFLGDSHMQHNLIALTKEGTPIDASRSAGVVLYNHPIYIDPHSKKIPSFYTRFAFYIDNQNGDEEGFGDGLAFLISPDNFLLGSPGYLGLVDSMDITKNKFIAIEFDTKCDSMFLDPDDNHVGLDINSLYSVKLATSSSLGVNLKSGNLINTWIDYKSNEKRLEVFLTYSNLKPERPLLNIDIDLSDYLLKDNWFVGFSGATEGSKQLTHIERWEFNIMEFSPPPPPSPLESGRTFPNPTDSGLSKFAIALIVGVCCIPFVVLFGWFCWKKLMWMIHKSEGTNNLEMQTIRSSEGISCQDILLSILVDEVARRLNIEKVLDNEVEVSSLKTVKYGIPHCSSLSAVNPNVVPVCNGLPVRPNDITSV